MKTSTVTDLLLVAIAPAILMVYGWYLGQTGVSMQDLAGMILFATGVIGLVLGIIGYFLIKPKKWYWNMLLGIVGVVVVFVGVIIYARVSG